MSAGSNCFNFGRRFPICLSGFKIYYEVATGTTISVLSHFSPDTKRLNNFELLLAKFAQLLIICPFIVNRMTRKIIPTDIPFRSVTSTQTSLKITGFIIFFCGGIHWILANAISNNVVPCAADWLCTVRRIGPRSKGDLHTNQTADSRRFTMHAVGKVNSTDGNKGKAKQVSVGQWRRARYCLFNRLNQPAR